MTYIKTKTQTGEAMIVMTEVVAIVRTFPIGRISTWTYT